jgi:hypothetical protein
MGGDSILIIYFFESGKGRAFGELHLTISLVSTFITLLRLVLLRCALV